MAKPEGPLDRFELAGKEIAGRFRVDEAIARGGFAVVYRGTQLVLDRRVAIKVLRLPEALADETRQSFLRSFLDEARTMVRLTHASIVQVLDFGFVPVAGGGEAPWMALEWLDGYTLRSELLARRGQGGMRSADAVAKLRPALEALAFAHEQGIAHRDVKPANIMVVPARRGTTLKVLDFGIAKLMGEESDDAGSGETRTESLLQAYSLPYAAPEQVSGRRTGPWTDVHAMGLLLTECLTDEPPYESGDRTILMGSVLSRTRPTPRRRAGKETDLEEVLERALALQPADRYRTAGELLDALDAALGLAQAPVSTERFGSLSAAAGGPVGGLAGAARGESEGESDVSAATLQGSTSSRVRAAIAPRPRWPLAAAGLLGLTALAMTALAFRPRAQPQQRQQPRALAAVASAAESAAPSTFHVRFESEPTSAVLELDGVRTGGHAFDQTFARDGRTHRLRVTAAGYAPREITFRDAPPAPNRAVLVALPDTARPEAPNPVERPSAAGATAPLTATATARAVPSVTARPRRERVEQGANGSLILN